MQSATVTQTALSQFAEISLASGRAVWLVGLSGSATEKLVRKHSRGLAFTTFNSFNFLERDLRHAKRSNFKDGVPLIMVEKFTPEQSAVKDLPKWFQELRDAGAEVVLAADLEPLSA